MQRLGYLAANSGFGATELLAMTADEIAFWVGCLSSHFARVNEEQEG